MKQLIKCRPDLIRLQSQTKKTTGSSHHNKSLSLLLGRGHTAQNATYKDFGKRNQPQFRHGAPTCISNHPLFSLNDCRAMTLKVNSPHQSDCSKWHQTSLSKKHICRSGKITYHNKISVYASWSPTETLSLINFTKQRPTPSSLAFCPTANFPIHSNPVKVVMVHFEG